MTATPMKLTKIGQILVDSLNEDAQADAEGIVYLSRRPSSPSYYFFQLVCEARPWGGGPIIDNPRLRAHLNEHALALLALRWHEEREQWCTCCDYMLKGGETCWSCVHDCHDRCRFECETGAVMHFPEIRIRTRAVAA